MIARPQTAAALGIDTRRVMRASFVLGTGLAGLAGALVAPLISVDPQMGLGYLVPAFLAILIGGAGPLAGVLVGGGAGGRGRQPADSSHLAGRGPDRRARARRGGHPAAPERDSRRPR